MPIPIEIKPIEPIEKIKGKRGDCPLFLLTFTADTNDATNNKFLDMSGNCQNFTSVGATKLSKRGISLNGSSDYLELPETTVTNGLKNMSILVTIKPLTLTLLYRAIITKWDYQTQGAWVLQFARQFGGSTPLIVGIDFYVANALDDNGVNYASSDLIFRAGTIYTIIVSYNGSLDSASRVKIYINGQPIALTITGTIPISLQSASSTIKIGKWGGGVTGYNNAEYYDLRVYSHSFTQIQVNDYHRTMMKSIQAI